MMLSEIPINIFSEFDHLIQRAYEVLILSGIVKELRELSISASPKKRKKATFALEFLKKVGIKIIEENLLPNETYDDYIVRIAKKKKFVVATNDRDLRQKLRKEHIPTIYLRQSSHLALEGYIGGSG